MPAALSTTAAPRSTSFCTAFCDIAGWGRWRVAVQGDHVALAGDLGRERRPPLDLLADEEERGLDVRRRQHLQHRRSPLGVGTVVERDRHPVGIGEPARHVERGGGLRNVWSYEMSDHVDDFLVVAGHRGPHRADCLGSFSPYRPSFFPYAREA